MSPTKRGARALSPVSVAGPLADGDKTPSAPSSSRKAAKRSVPSEQPEGSSPPADGPAGEVRGTLPSGERVTYEAIEVATTGRASCRACAQKIAQGVPRLSYSGSFRGRPTTSWVHAACALARLESSPQALERLAGWSDLDEATRSSIASDAAHAAEKGASRPAEEAEAEAEAAALARKAAYAERMANRDGIERMPTPRAPDLPADMPGLRVVAWNLGGLRAWLSSAERREELAAGVAEERPDVLFFLETKLQPGDIEAKAKADLLEVFPAHDAHFATCTAKKGYSGVCALVRRGLDGVRTPEMGIGELDEEGRVITVPVERDGLPPLDVVCAYTPNSGTGLDRLGYRIKTWDPSFRAFINERHARGRRVVVVGDLNVAHLDADIWNWGQSASKDKAIGKNAGTTPEERASFGVLLEECTLTDTFRARHPEATGVFSYWSVRMRCRPVNRGLRLDYALATAEMAAEDAAIVGGEAAWRVHDSFILDNLNEKGDHAAVGCVLAHGAPP